MIRHSKTSRNRTYQVSLRRGGPGNPRPHITPYRVHLTHFGIAAARETLTSATPHMAAIWTDLFKSMLLPGSDLRWRGNGPGIGRDARIAYSGLLGRYMARAFVTEDGGVRVLVPLDVAKRRLEGSRYSIEKDPPGRGYLAAWIGLDHRGLVIVEAKGTYDPNKSAWKGPKSLPACLETAIDQAKRTTVVAERHGSYQTLPTKCWAIASRWGTEFKPMLDPTLVAWCSGRSDLRREDYIELGTLLLRADADGIIEALGHAETTRSSEWWNRGFLVGDLPIERGYGAVFGLFGIHPLRNRSDFFLLNQILQYETGIAVASLSEEYLFSLSRKGIDALGWWPESALGESTVAADTTRGDVPFAVQGGLTVAWLEGGRRAVSLE